MHASGAAVNGGGRRVLLEKSVKVDGNVMTLRICVVSFDRLAPEWRIKWTPITASTSLK